MPTPTPRSGLCGFARARALQTDVGDVPVPAPQVRDDRKGSEQRIRFTSNALSPAVAHEGD